MFIHYFCIVLFSFLQKVDGTEEKSPQLEGSVESDSFHGDVESLSSDSLEQTLDAEDDLSEIISKGNVNNVLKFPICL